jgi:hypothetical protein
VIAGDVGRGAYLRGRGFGSVADGCCGCADAHDARTTANARNVSRVIREPVE